MEKIEVANFTDWRMPTLKELATLYDPTQENNMAWDHNPEYSLALDKKFCRWISVLVLDFRLRNAGAEKMLYQNPLFRKMAYTSSQPGSL